MACALHVTSYVFALRQKNPDEYERRGTQARPTVEMAGPTIESHHML